MSDEARCTITVTIHPWCLDVQRDEAVRAAEDGRPGPLPTLEECIGMLPKTGSATSAVEHENKGNDMGTKAEAQAAAYRAEASEQPAPAPPAANGLRTERVVLEITHSEPTRADSWGWGSRLCPWLRPGLSVRVVEEADRIEVRLSRLQAAVQSAREQCETAIREREYLRRSFHWSEEAGTRLVAERDASLDDAAGLRARVAELEGQLESVADRAAAAETALEAAPAASGNSQAILDGSPAASDAAGTATWFAAVGKFGHKNVCMAFNSFEQCEEFANGEVRIVPLYSAPQPAKGWLTPEDREFLEQMRDDSGIRCLGTISAVKKDRELRTFEVLRAILARSSPPEVVLHEERDWYDGSGFRVPAYDASKVQGALAAAGVPSKEVGCE